MNPKFTIITVCYNSSLFIRTAIDSVLSQDYHNIEYIIVDGGSTDNTLDLIRSYGNQISLLISEPDLGIYDAMNKGLSLATGDIIGILNSDDFYLYSDVISTIVQSFEVNPEVDLVLGDVDFVYPDNLVKPTRFYSSHKFKPWKLFFGIMPPHPASFVRRSSYMKVGFYKIIYKIGADFEWFTRAFFKHNLNFKIINKTIIRIRVGGISTDGIKCNWVATKDMYKALADNNLNSYGLVFFRLPIKLYKLIIFKLFLIIGRMFKK